ncbi:hypothetical protein VTO42DRAFT_8694 [Malbranchea cinnamomea]
MSPLQRVCRGLKGGWKSAATPSCCATLVQRSGERCHVWSASTEGDETDQAVDGPGWPNFTKEMQMQEFFRNSKHLRRMLYGFFLFPIKTHALLFQNAAGSFPSPLDCWLARRGLKTLHLRALAASRNAESLAETLDSSPHVIAVNYPGPLRPLEVFRPKNEGRLKVRGTPQLLPF